MRSGATRVFEPEIVRGVRVLAREDEYVAGSELGAEIPRPAVVELARRDLVHARAESAGTLDAAVDRTRIDDDDLDLLIDLLHSDRLEAADEVGAAVS